MLNVLIGDHVELRKPHPCGSRVWIVRRVGADLRLECTGCGRTLMLSRSVFNRRARRIVQRAGEGSDEAAGPTHPTEESSL